jgi:hypothetical protein
MSISKAYATGVSDSASGTALTTGTFDSTGYTHLVAFFKNEDGGTTVTMSDNKSSPSWTSLTQNLTAWNLTAQMFWVKIGTPGSGHTVTATPSSSVSFRALAVWLVNCTSGEMELVDEDGAEATSSSAIDAGTLSNPGAASVVSFLGVAEFNPVTYTPGSGWTEDEDGIGTNNAYASSRGPDVDTTIDPVCTSSGTMDWNAVASMFKEVGASALGVRIQFAGSFGRGGGRRARYPL